MQDNPFYNYYRGELNEWQDYAEANAFKITDAEASEYGLKFNLSGIKYSRFSNTPVLLDITMQVIA